MKVLIFSSASIVNTNRAYIRDLSINFKLDIHLCILYRGNLKNFDEKTVNYEPFNISLHQLIGIHARLESIRDIGEILTMVRPSHILMEFDPASKFVVDVLRYSKNYDSRIKVGCLVVENRDRKYLNDAFEYLFNFKAKLFIGNLICFYYNRLSVKKLNYLWPISSEASGVYLKLGYSNHIIQKIPLGIDNNVFYNRGNEVRQAYRRKLGLKSYTIGYFGRLVPEKGIHLLIKALSELKSYDWQLLIDKFDTYKSPYSKELAHLILENDLQDRIAYFDSSHDEMPCYYSSIDLLVLPSVETRFFKEQYGRVLVEAMLTKTLVIGSNTGAIPEVLNDRKFVFQTNDVASLRNKIIEIYSMSDMKLNELRERNFSMSMEKLTSMKQAELLYESISVDKE